MAVSCCCLLAKALRSNISSEVQIKKTKKQKKSFLAQATKQALANSRVSLLLAGHVASAPGLETDDDVRDLHVSLLLQVSEDSRPEENFALADPEQVGIQLQAFDLT